MNVAEKPNSNFENIIASQVGDLDGLGGEEGVEVASEKVSEVVGENASESIPQGKKNTQTQTRGAKDNQKHQVRISQARLVLPTPQKQKRELKRIITKRTNNLIKEVTRLQRSKDYSPAKTEALIQEIRSLRKILANLFNATLQKVETLYRQFVWKQ